MNAKQAIRVSKLDLFLAGGMRPSEDLRARLSAAQVPPGAVDAVRLEADSRGLGRPLELTRGTVVSFFGEPRHEDEGRLTYDLALWPEHRFQWRTHANGKCGPEGFLLVNAVELPTWLPHTASVAKETLVPCLHTAHEARMLLGEPDSETGWGQAYEWRFAGPSGQEHLVLDFDWGLLRSLDVAEGPLPQSDDSEPLDADG